VRCALERVAAKGYHETRQYEFRPNHREVPSDQLIGLDWIGLDWIGLHWIGLHWIGLCCVDRLSWNDLSGLKDKNELFSPVGGVQRGICIWQMDTVNTHGRIVAPRFFVIPKLDALEGTFAEEVDDVVPSPG